MKTIRLRSLVGTFYPQQTPYSKGLVIVAIGAPNLEDIESLRNRDILTKNGYDIFVPEYYGYCRSGGSFSPNSSLQSLLDSYDAFCHGYSWYDIYTSAKFIKKYKKIFFLGLSYGGGLVPIVPRFRPHIAGIGCFYPVVDYISLGQIGVREETGIEFIQLLKNEFSYIYRGIDVSIWKSHFGHQDDSIPIQAINMRALEGVNIFLAHGEEDESVSSKHTEKYYQNLKQMFPEQNIVYNSYIGRGHDSETLMVATYDFVRWLDSL